MVSLAKPRLIAGGSRVVLVGLFVADMTLLILLSHSRFRISYGKKTKTKIYIFIITGIGKYTPLRRTKPIGFNRKNNAFDQGNVCCFCCFKIALEKAQWIGFFTR
jgi:hypothetical protein